MAKTLRTLLLGAVAAISCTATAQSVTRATAPDLQLYGSIIGSFNEPGSYYNESGGIYTFNLRQPAGITLVKSGVHTYGGGTYAQGSYYHNDFTESSDGSRITMPIRLYRHNATDWSQESLSYGYAFSCITYDMTFDPETQQLYAIFADDAYSGKRRLFGRFRYKEQEGAPLYECDSIAAFPEVMVALTADRNGTLYAIDKKANLYTVDKYTGATKLVGNTGVQTQAMFQSAACNYTNGKIYWATIYNDMWDTGIFEVDPATAKSTLVSDFGYDYGTATCDQFTGIYFKEDLDLQALPDTVTNLSATFSSATSGEAVFTLPSTATDGTTLSGTVNYTVRLNGNVVATGSGEAGAITTVPLQTAAEGETKVGVVSQRPATATQPAATSKEVTATAWVGHDVPEAPARVSIRAAGNDVTVSWKAPSQGVHRGYIDADNMTFTLTRYIEGRDEPDAVVAKDIKATTYTDHIASEAKNVYYYTITARNGDFTSKPATTRTVKLGTQIGFPYSNAFASSPFDEDFTVIDANADDNTWTYSESDKNVQYNANAQSADDWFITPAFSVKKGAIYTFSFTMKGGYSAERIAAYLGEAPTAEALTTEVIAPTEIAQAYYGQTLKGTFRATADATLHFGIHATSDAYAGTLQVDDLSITECPVTAPEPVAQFKATPGAKGINQADITFTAPSATLEGTPLEGALTIDITRDGKTLKTLTGVQPGAACSYSDTYVSTDFHTYAATATAADGQQSVEAAATIFVGLDKPGPVRNLRIVEDLDKEGLVHLTWDAPETGMNGGYIDPEGLTYYISGGVSSSSDFSIGNATHYDEQLSPNGKQIYQAYSVYAGNSAGNGRSQVWQTASVIAGPALKAPVFESFDGATMKSGPWLTKMTNGKIGEAYCYVMSEATDIVPADLDGGLQVFSATSLGKSARSESPKVDISALAKPVLHFWAYFNGKGDSLTVSVSPDYKGFEPVLRLSSADAAGWKRFAVDLSPYRSSRFVQIGLEGKAVASLEYFMAYDNVSITDTYADDLMMRALTSPDEMNTLDESDFKVAIRNNGDRSVKAADYSIVLYRNHKEVARQQGEDLAVDAKIEFMFTDKASVLETEKNVYQAAIEFAADENPANNLSQADTVKVTLPDYPTPSALKATKAANGATLSWTAPDLDNLKKQSYTETFEDFPAFTISEMGEWTLVDGDKQETKRIMLSSVIGALQYDHAGEAMAYQVFNVTQAGIPFATWDPHSGEQMLLCFAASSTDESNPVKPNDDWLISPALDGSAQTISFYAKAAQGSTYVPEEMELLYSMESTDTATFVKVDKVGVTNAKTWDEYRFDVPEGAKYFAIRCVSNNKLALMLDDITFIPEGAESVELTLKGYNVYRDSVLVNASPVTATDYVDTTVDTAKDYTYHVTAVYAEGESLPSNAACTDGTSAIVRPSASAVTVSTAGHTIVVNHAAGLDVALYTADGRTLAVRKAAKRETFRVEPGIYVVKAGSVRSKIVVK